MTTWIIVIAYLTVGCGAAAAVVVQKVRIGSLGGAPAALVVLVLWPFMLPTAFLAEPLPPPRGAGRIEALTAEVLAHYGSGDPQRRVVEVFAQRLTHAERRVAELDAAITSAPASVRDELTAMRSDTSGRLDAGCALLEEIGAQLTLLRFVDESEGESSERENVEALLSQVEALTTVAQLTAPGAA